MFRFTVIVALISYALSAPQLSFTGQYPFGGRIVGGEDADIADYPYQLSLRYEGYGHFCGAALIASDWALTAAHCTDGLDAADITVHAGSSYRENNDGQLVNISKIIQNANFSWVTADGDIALLQLASSVTVETASVIPLATTIPTSGELADITGWGITSEDDEDVGPNTLQKIEVPIVDHVECETAYSTVNETLTEGMICAGLLGVGGKDSCSEDSGGPLAIGGILNGIVSWGEGCARADYPGVYTAVSYYREWIKENSGV